MNARTMISTIALGRLGLGAAMLVAPDKAVGAGWIGREAARPLSSLMIRAVGARDVGLAIGTLITLRQGGPLKPWLIGASIADATDCVATTLAGSAVPPQGRVAVGALGGGALVAQLALLRGVD